MENQKTKVQSPDWILPSVSRERSRSHSNRDTSRRNSCFTECAYSRVPSLQNLSPPSDYKRNYSLCSQPTPHRPRHLEVQRGVASPTKHPPWNSNCQKVGRTPVEKLPRISMLPANKYDLLYNGGSVAHVRKSLPTQRHVGEFVRKESGKFAVAATEERRFAKYFARLLRQVEFAEAENDWIKDVSHSRAVSEAKAVFDTLSHHTQHITADMLHEYFLLYTPPGVASYEARDFLMESCDGLEVLKFGDFLRYGESLRDRLFTYGAFAPLDDVEKFVSIAVRVCLKPTPLTMMKLQWLVIRAAEAQLIGQETNGILPMRLYELSFLMEVKKTMGHRDSMRRCSFAKKSMVPLLSRNVSERRNR